jgi:EAL domain-containing protein (putative c-di-GMP-specific phosphodiesterase class I)
MAFQPVVDLRERRIDAYEALVRGTEGESAGYILSRVTIENRYAFDQACRAKAIELAANLGIDRRLNINFLPNAMYQPAACVKHTMVAAMRARFPLEQLTFEVVEHEETAELEHLKQIFTTYRHHGFQVALDDFGVGYSGLTRLAELRPDIVKLDRALIRDCDRHESRLKIIAAMIRLGRELGTKVVLEGVETLDEVLALESVGGRFMQGFFFARPAFEAAVPDSAILWPEMALAAE